MASQNNKNLNNNQGTPGPGNKPPMPDPFNNKFKFSLWYFVIILIGLVIINYVLSSASTTSFIDLSAFKDKIASGEIKRVEITDKYYAGYTTTGNYLQENGPVYKAVPVLELDFIKFLDEHNVQYFAPPTQNNRLLELLLSWIIPLGIFLLIWRVMLKRMGGAIGSNVMTFGQNRSKVIAEGDVDTRFKDVAGADEAKQELEEVVDFLKNPGKYSAIGGKIPKGVLLVGPPGCGKTLLGRAVAGEAEVTFFRMSGADFVEMFVGVGASRVRDLFKQAREKSPCIIFIDELDAIGKSRANSLNGNDEREQTLNQLLVEMDGFDGRTGVIIIGATNRPEILDSALLRPGRFDRQILVDKPDLIGREQILKIHAKNVINEDHVNLKNVALSTPGFSGADLANVVNEAALLAVRRGAKKVAQKDYEEAIEKVIAGLEKRSRVINPKEKKIVAYHETGHAITAHFTEGADQVQKISIIPRGLGALGYTLQMPTEDRFLMTEQELLGKIDVLLGGRAAEQLIFNQISTGASNDIMKATDIIRRMITEYGMSERFKNVTLPSQRNAMFLDKLPGSGREYSEATQQYIDEETARIINQRYNHVLGLLKDKITLLKNISLKLLEEEVLGADRFKELINEG